MTRFSHLFERRALLHADAVQVENPWMLDYVQGLNRQRTLDLRYAPPGIDTHKFVPNDDRLSNTRPFILCVGRLSDGRKNVGLLLEAYAQLPLKLRGGIDLILAGQNGPPLPFWRRVRTLGLEERVRYIAAPSLSSLIALYQGASVFALPSKEEGLGMVLLEAMACGVPVIATRCGGPDGIITNGHDGFLVDSDDVQALTAQLERICSDPDLNTKMGANARRTAVTRYSEESTGAVFLDIWARLSRS